MKGALFLLAAGLAVAQVEVSVPTKAVPFPANGKTAIAYELRVENKSSTAVTMKRVDAGDKIFEGAALKKIVRAEKVDAGGKGVVFLWFAYDGAVPERIHNKILFDSGSAEADAAIEKVALPVIGPPLHGGDWLAANGPSDTSIHRRAELNVDGHRWLAQRFAIDWVVIDAGGKTHNGNAKQNPSYYAYGKQALAIGEATVVTIKDGIVENVPGENSRAVKITLETIGGNYVVLDLGNGRFAFYGHLQPGSLRVKAGDHVKRGDVLGLVGNSGNSDEPHLHFHVMDRGSPLESEGVPFLFDSYESRNKGKNWEKRERALPLENEIVRFP
jgi:murein DD-endopeptidase MepM/ murein hydrolase activator NlpD